MAESRNSEKTSPNKRNTHSTGDRKHEKEGGKREKDGGKREKDGRAAVSSPSGTSGSRISPGRQQSAAEKSRKSRDGKESKKKSPKEASKQPVKETKRHLGKEPKEKPKEKPEKEQKKEQKKESKNNSVPQKPQKPQKTRKWERLHSFSARYRSFLNSHSRFLFLLLVLILSAAAIGVAVRGIRFLPASYRSGRSDSPVSAAEYRNGSSGEPIPMTADGRPAIITADGRMVPVAEVQLAASVVIEAGDTAAETAAALKQAGILSSSRQLKNYLVKNNLDRSIQAGTYRMPQGLPVKDAAEILLTGSVDSFDLHIYPGMTVREIISRLNSRFPDTAADELLQQAERRAAARGYQFLEGFCFPGCYRCYQYGLSVELIVDACLSEFERAVAPWWADIGDTAGDPASLVIIASMIQRETQNPEEMPFIAGIIYNRLEADMPLGIDATIRYELDDWQNPLTKADLTRDTPFNTRTRRGLPPAPIGSPGADALKAAVYPADTDFFYYLHDPSGTIHYGRKYEDHLRNIDRHLR